MYVGARVRISPTSTCAGAPPSRDTSCHTAYVANINPGGPVNTNVGKAANQTDLPCLAIFIVERCGVFGHDVSFLLTNIVG